MKKKLSTLLFVFILCVGMMVPAFAESLSDIENLDGLRVLDTANLLSDSEADELNEKIIEIRDRHQFDIVIYTTDEPLETTPQEYADDIYDAWQFGCGNDRDGVLLLISMDDRDWYISTCGFGITAFTEAGIEYIGEQITPDLSDGNYAAAFNAFADLCDDFVTQAKSGSPYDINTLPREPLSAVYIPVSIAIGFILALIGVGGMKAKLKTVRRQSAADSYMKGGSLNITESRDLFLYSTITQTARPKESSSGGSDTHTSSSGTTHGGGGGRF